jgi:hypothetical protein
MALSRIFGPMKNEMTRWWRQLHDKELRDLFSSPSVIRIIKSRRMRWVGHLARMRELGTHVGYCWELRNLGGWIILRWILERWNKVVWTGLVRFRIRTSGEFL